MNIYKEWLSNPYFDEATRAELKAIEGDEDVYKRQVYRNLNLLEELGEVRKLRCGSGPDHFDGDMAPHYHFLCRTCGRVSDIPMSHMEEINTLAGRYYPGRIEGHEMVFYGECCECLDMKEIENISGKPVDKTS